MKVLVIGQPEAVLGFSLAGVEGISASTPDEINKALDKGLAKNGIGIILITQDASSQIQGRMDLLRKQSTVPLVVEIPGPEGTGADQSTIGDILLRAIGIKL